jgi:enoyl-CoA hydratase
MNPLQARIFSEKGHRAFATLSALSIPVIACVNGFALGGGCELALSCDFMYASEKAKFGQPEINLGIMPGFGGSQRLTRFIGKAKAKELCMTGSQITAQEAKELGLVAQIFPAEELWEETMKVAKSLAQKGRTALKAIKETIDKGADVDLCAGCTIEQQAFAMVFASEDAQEGTTAFLEKRTPDFKGTLMS